VVKKFTFAAELVDGADFICIRELTAVFILGPSRKKRRRKYSLRYLYLYPGKIERIIHLAYRFASQSRKKVTMVDKANI
jgi:3-isopropylmalate dehydrogenase